MFLFVCVWACVSCILPAYGITLSFSRILKCFSSEISDHVLSNYFPIYHKAYYSTEAEPDFPSDPYSEPDVDTYRTVLTNVLRTFLRQPRNLSPAVLGLIDNKVPLRSHAQRTNILDTIWAFPDA